MKVYIDARNRFTADEKWAVREWGGDWKVLSRWFENREDAVKALKGLVGVEHFTAGDCLPATRWGVKSG